MKELIVESPAFTNKGIIPQKYTCDGDNISPPLRIENITEGIQSLALIVEDPDAPSGTFDHWVVWNIPPMREIKEDTVPGTEGLNSFGKHSYGGPCPPSGVHRYFFKVYALDNTMILGPDAKKGDVLSAIQGHVLAHGEIIGLYAKEKSHYDIYTPKEDELQDS